MNDNHSGLELDYKSRWLAPHLHEAVKDHPVVVLTGARQVGKSTLLQFEPPHSNWHYYTLDDYDVLSQTLRDPSSLWAGTERLIIDEVQKAPNLMESIKIAVDSQRQKFQFILSGSANLLLMKKVSESLAGRAVYFTLLPMTVGEAKDLPAPNTLINLFNGTPPPEGQIRKRLGKDRF